MDIQSGASLDAWLRTGEVVIASTDRAARAIQADYHRRRRTEGLSAWAAPGIADWNSFAHSQWELRNSDGRLLLNRAQELAIWSEIIHSEQHLPTALPPSVRRLAAMAMEAHDLVCSYAPRLLRDEARAGWDQDAGAFSRWLADFSRRCTESGFISASRVPLELTSMLRADPDTRHGLSLAGFDRFLPVQRALFDAWGACEEFKPDALLAQSCYYSAADSQTELEACAYWCDQQISATPGIRLLIITQDQSRRRGEIERAFLRFHPPLDHPVFEFSLGVPLSQIPFVRSAVLLIRWLQGPLTETELDWLFASNFAATVEQSAALQSCMRTLRRLDLQRPKWNLESFLSQSAISSNLPREWVRQIITAQRTLREAPASQSPIDWVDMVPHLLAVSGWRGALPQTSADFQAQRRWTQALDTAGSLGFDGSRISWSDFLIELQNAAEEILFAPQSADAPIQIAGPAESAGLTADALWFLGADEESWPAVASAHPFVPIQIQREFGMPHSSQQTDWEFSEAITNRLLSSASLAYFSFACQKDGIDSRPSRLIAQFTDAPQPLAVNLLPPANEKPSTVLIEDFSSKPYSGSHLQGGAAILSYQSQCPFKAFATARLGAQSWNASEAGLSARQRGQLLHEVLHSIWSGIETHQDLKSIGDLTSFVRKHVQIAMQASVPAHVREQMPPMYLELEETRLIRLAAEWLEFEKARLAFKVQATEAKSTVTIGSLSMNLRLDRVDRLQDGSQLVIDYKTGTVHPSAWDLPRPDDVQLPLYKLFGLAPLQPSLFDSFGGPASGGLVFARVRVGDTCFAGRVANARETINPELNGNSALVKRRLTAAVESEWKAYIEKLAGDFVHGRAEVDPRDYPHTCEHCGLQAVCRIQEPENRVRFEQEEPEPYDADRQ